MPLDRPYSAWYPDVRIFTSSIASTLVSSIWPLLPVSMIAMPSTMYVLFWDPTLPRRVVPTTPGVSAASEAQLRVMIGTFCTASLLTVNERSPLLACTSGASVDTVTVSAMPPTSSISVPAAFRSPGLTAMFCRSSVLNPSSATLTV